MSNTGQCGHLAVSRQSLSRSGKNGSTVLPVTLGCRVSDCQQQIAAQYKQHLPKIYSRWHECSLVFGKDTSDLSNFKNLGNLKKKKTFKMRA
jgi:hypothetical protein